MSVVFLSESLGPLASVAAPVVRIIPLSMLIPDDNPLVKIPEAPEAPQLLKLHFAVTRFCLRKSCCIFPK
ncbi:MAG: hypothetical protein F6K18_29680 [Okeania sp. SIO2C2]|nr:hypothetical protein [Okeania sp. SIO2C2]NEP90654.1 hypothetical protein [Okeania sp. SIO2C2]